MPKRTFILSVLVLLATATAAVPQNAGASAPEDVALSIGCAAPCRFREGEVIHLTLNFSASAGSYSVQAMDGSRQRGLDSFTATPAHSVSDPLAGNTLGMNPSGIFDVPRLSPGQPFTVTIELNQWIRFGCPGNYRVTAQSSRIFLDSDPASRHNRLLLISGPIDLEIVAAGGSWQQSQLARILPELPQPGAGYSPASAAAIRALAYLGSAGALQEIRKHVSEAPFSNDFRKRNAPYLLDWEMARLELLRHKQ